MSVGRYQAYPEYKDSGIAWLGDMPKTWELRKAKHLFERVQRPVRESDGIVTAFRDGQVTLRSNRREDGFTNAVKEIGYQGVRNGDLLVHAMDGFAGAIGVSDSDGKCSPVCAVCTPWDMSQIDIRYYGYLVRQLAVTDYITSLAKGIRERSTEFRFSEFSGLELALPTKCEQTQIAAFLDHETAKIDRLIEKQQALISLLKEKRQAVISHAVTKGLNPHSSSEASAKEGAPLKDSGIEWLGQVPAHWDVVPIKHLCTLLKDGTHLPPARVDEGVPLLSVRNVINGKFTLREDDSKISRSDYLDLCRSFVPVKGDVLLAIVGGTIGKVAVVEDMPPFHIQRSLAIFRTESSAMINESLANVLCSSGFQKLLWANVGFSAQPGIYLGALQDFRVPVAPLTEQSAINQYCREGCAKFDNLIARAESAIALMQERRTALISAAVTGKIDVRHWQPPHSTFAA